MKLLAINGAGVGNSDGLRARRLLDGFVGEATVVDLDRSSRKASMLHMTSLLAPTWDLIYLESTGIGAGLPLIHAAQRGARYIVSAGDPVAGFFHVTRGPLHGFLFGIYERILYRRSVGFVGWTPYLTGRAIGLGAPCGVTVEGAVDTGRFHLLSAGERADSRARFGIAPNQLVFGTVGSLAWSERQCYAYGLELIESLSRTTREDLTVMIVGDGDGRTRLESRVPPNKRHQVLFTGRLSETDVVQAMNAMDVGFVSQTLDALGMYRLTTKLPEYLACGLPVAMSPIPGFFDYVGSSAGWPLPAHHPGREAFWNDCGRWMQTLTKQEITARAVNTRRIAETRFEYQVLRPRFHSFLAEVGTGDRKRG